MARRRWLLFGLSLGSLVILTYASLLFAFSVPDEGSRALVAPIVDPTLVETHAREGKGERLVAGDGDGAVPSTSSNVSVGLALAYVSPGANGTYSPALVELTDVPTGNGTQNLTVDAAQLAGGQSGWIVLGDDDAAPRFVPREQALGTVVRHESPVTLGVYLALGLVGFVAPLVILIATHRGAGRAGPNATLNVCRECRAPLAPNETFCTRCGAYRSG